MLLGSAIPITYEGIPFHMPTRSNFFHRYDESISMSYNHDRLYNIVGTEIPISNINTTPAPYLMLIIKNLPLPLINTIEMMNFVTRECTFDQSNMYVLKRKKPDVVANPFNAIVSNTNYSAVIKLHSVPQKATAMKLFIENNLIDILIEDLTTDMAIRPSAPSGTGKTFSLFTSGGLFDTIISSFTSTAEVELYIYEYYNNSLPYPFSLAKQVANPKIFNLVYDENNNGVKRCPALSLMPEDAHKKIIITPEKIAANLHSKIQSGIEAVRSSTDPDNKLHETIRQTRSNKVSSRSTIKYVLKVKDPSKKDRYVTILDPPGVESINFITSGDTDQNGTNSCLAERVCIYNPIIFINNYLGHLMFDFMSQDTGKLNDNRQRVKESERLPEFIKEIVGIPPVYKKVLTAAFGTDKKALNDCVKAGIEELIHTKDNTERADFTSTGPTRSKSNQSTTDNRYGGTDITFGDIWDQDGEVSMNRNYHYYAGSYDAIYFLPGNNTFTENKGWLIAPYIQVSLRKSTHQTLEETISEYEMALVNHKLDSNKADDGLHFLEDVAIKTWKNVQRFLIGKLCRRTFIAACAIFYIFHESGALADLFDFLAKKYYMNFDTLLSGSETSFINDLNYANDSYNNKDIQSLESVANFTLDNFFYESMVSCRNIAVESKTAGFDCESPMASAFHLLFTDQMCYNVFGNVSHTLLFSPTDINNIHHKGEKIEDPYEKFKQVIPQCFKYPSCVTRHISNNKENSNVRTQFENIAAYYETVNRAGDSRMMLDKDTYRGKGGKKTKLVSNPADIKVINYVVLANFIDDKDKKNESSSKYLAQFKRSITDFNWSPKT